MSNATTAEGVCAPPDGLSPAGASGFYCMTRGQSVGLVVVAMSGFVSLTAVVVIFALILRNVIRAWGMSGQRRLIAKPMDIFMLSLFTADLFQSLGVVLEVKWIGDGIVRVGPLCTVQGVMQNIGEAAVAMATLIITLHTFASIWWGKGVQSLVTAGILVGIQWLFLILFVAISASTHPQFYTPTPYWCWISSMYPHHRTAGENFWLWLAFSVSVLYIPLFFWSRGYVTPSSHTWWKFRIHAREDRGFEGTQRRISLSLIYCALTFCIPVIPTGLARWFLVVHGDVKPFANPEAQFSVKAIFSLSGIFDVLVFFLTRQDLLLFKVRRRPQSVDPHQTSNISETPWVDPKSTSNADDSGQFLPEFSPADSTAAGEPSPPLASRLRIGSLVCLWLVVNAIDAVWICYYVRAATDPNPHTSVNRSRAGWIAYYMMMYIFGFLWGCVNIIVWSMYFQIASKWFSKKMESRMSKRSEKRQSAKGNVWYRGHIVVILPVIVVMCLGPFFSPYVGLKISEKQAWNHRCDEFPGEVSLEGRLYGLPEGTMPRASFYFGQQGRRTKYYEYVMIPDGADANVWHFVLSQVVPGVTIPPEIYPLVQVVSYQLANRTLSANCTNFSPNATSCMQGSFEEKGYLSFMINDTRAQTVTNLRAVDKKWFPLAADDAPSFILKEVGSDNSLGQTVLRSAVTESGHCSSLKLCAGTGIDVLAPVGLALLRQDAYSGICTAPNSN